MLRRRLPFIIVSDAGEDPNYQWNDISLLTQKVREDFNAEIVWMDFKAARDQADKVQKNRIRQKPPKQKKGCVCSSRTQRWQDILTAYFGCETVPEEWIPGWIRDWIDPDTLGALHEIGRETDFHAALARVTYFNSNEVSWILLFKPGLGKRLSQDLLNYGKVNPAFPQTPTFDQFFDDVQWESYRALGQQIAERVLR